MFCLSGIRAMSTFSGQLKEIQDVSIDRFDGNNLKSKLFFLSHCHTDHMVGLDNPDGLPGPLYLSPVSAVIVRQQYPSITRLICLNIGGKNECPLDEQQN